MSQDIPTLRWGIVGCGLISSWFVRDLMVPRPTAPVHHIIQAIGSSSVNKAAAFVTAHCASANPSVCGTYEEVYNDPLVDIVYIGTPHVAHLDNALAAIKANKHVLCEKPMCINAKGAEILIKAAKDQGVFLMEGKTATDCSPAMRHYTNLSAMLTRNPHTGVWTRFFPLVTELQRLLHKDQILGALNRVMVDFSLPMPISSLPSSSRTANPALGAGVLLDIGIYTLTWATLILGSAPAHIAAGSPTPDVTSSMTIKNGVDETTTIVLNYKDLQTQAILTSTMCNQGATEFCRIEGEHGTVSIGGRAASSPSFLVLRLKGKDERKLDFAKEGAAKGFYWEADAIGKSLAHGQMENTTMPLKETVRMLRLMDEIREMNGLAYPQES